MTNQNILKIIVILASLIIFFNILFVGYQKVQEKSEVPFYFFLEKIKKGEVKSITFTSPVNLIFEVNEGKIFKTTKDPDASLWEIFEKEKIEPKNYLNIKINQKSESEIKQVILAILLNLVPLIIIGWFFWQFLKQTQKGATQIFTFGKSGIKVYNPNDPNRVTFKDVAGLEEAKQELMEVVEFLKNPDKFFKIGAKIPKGVLLVGPPGSGKTLLARATAAEAGVPFFYISGSEFVEMFVGVGASIKGDEPVLIKENNEIKLLPIKEVADRYYEENEEGLKNVENLFTLGIERKNSTIYGFRNGEKFQIEKAKWVKVNSIYRHKVKEIYEIYYRGGKIETTGDHSIFVREKNYIQPKKVSELKPGDILVNLPFKVRGPFIEKTTHRIKAFESFKERPIELKIWEDDKRLISILEFIKASRDLVTQKVLAKIFGFSQDSISKWQRGIQLPTPPSLKVNKSKTKIPQKITLVPEFMRLLGYYTAGGRVTKYFTQFVFGIHEKNLHQDVISLMKKFFNLDPHLSQTKDNTLRITYPSKVLAEFFEKNCGNGSKNKHLPHFIWELNFDYVYEYIKGLYLGDGYMTKEGKLVIASSSKNLISEIAWLLALHGIQVGLRKTKNKGGRIIKNKPLPPGEYWLLIIGKTSNFWLSNNKKLTKEIKKPVVLRIVKKPYNGYVYDFCGCENEAFFAGLKPILVHNSRVRDAFAVAKRNQPSILFIDELDSIGKIRGVGITGGHEEREQTLNQILVEMDGFEKGTKVVVLAATNRPDVLDPALLRPGRFDRKIVLELPDIKAREEILKIHLRDKKIGKVNLRQIAERTPGFSGADLANLCNEAAILAARRNKEFITQKELLDSIEKVLLGPERKTKAYSKKEKEIAAYHEAGHALVAHYLKYSNPVQKISIIARGRAGGYTLKLPTEERSFYFKKEFLDELASMLGGYAAEKLIFNDITTGASNDLEIATQLAKELVIRFGMSEKLGPVSLIRKFSIPFGSEIYEREYSEKTAEIIDEEVRNLINDALRRATKVLEIKRDKLEKIAKILIKKEVIEQKQFEKLVDEPKGSLEV